MGPCKVRTNYRYSTLKCTQIFQLRKAIFCVFYNISQPNCSFSNDPKANLSLSKFQSEVESSSLTINNFDLC
jgi:hypothetical protein